MLLFNLSSYHLHVGLSLAYRYVRFESGHAYQKAMRPILELGPAARCWDSKWVCAVE